MTTKKPGEFPYKRGIYPNMYKDRLWTTRQYAGFTSADDSNKRFRALLGNGVKGLSVAFDLPSQIGYDSDHFLAIGEVGKVGVPICTLENMENLFKDIPLHEISTSMTINATAAIMLALYIVTAENKGIDPKNLKGTIQNDILKEYTARGTYIYPPVNSMRLITDIFQFCESHLPNWNTISVSGYHIREAGSTAEQELAFVEDQFKDTPTTVLNVGHKGSSNDIILRGLITSVDNLLREGKKIRKVIIQLTTMERKYMINQGKFEMSPPAQNFLKSSWSSWFMPMNEGFKNTQEFWKNYWENIHSDELHFFELLEKIFMVQSYLKSKNIDYTMFCGWDLFTDSTNKNIFSKEEKYENINNELLKDKFGYCNTETHNSKFGINYYWSMIDWDNWWFFNNDKIKFGGLTEWSQYNLEKDKWYQDDLHPSFDAHKKFKDVVILDLIYGGNSD